MFEAYLESRASGDHVALAGTLEGVLTLEAGEVETSPAGEDAHAESAPVPAAVLVRGTRVVLVGRACE